MTPENSSAAIASLFSKTAIRHLRTDYLPRWETLLGKLPDAALWWRPHPDCLCIGIILRHLRGNITQWILSGLGGRPDERERRLEFAGDFTESKRDLQEGLVATIQAACGVIESYDADSLIQSVTIQGYSKTPLEAIFHVVEHCGWHTGEAAHIAKAFLGQNHGIAFYDDARLNAARNATPI